MSHSYKDLIVWREAKSLASTVYRATEGFPKREWYGITSQIRRAAVSVPSNIAEGQGDSQRASSSNFSAMRAALCKKCAHSWR
jgi:four helix bundle protein